MTTRVRNLLLIALIAGLLMAIQFVTPIDGGLWWRMFYDAVHVPVFGLIAVAALVVTPSHWHVALRVVVALIATSALAAVSELIQVPTNRDASLSDFWADMLGGLGLVCIVVALFRRFGLGIAVRMVAFSAGVLAFLWPLLPLAQVSIGYVQRAQALPSLVHFDARFAEYFVLSQNAELEVVDDPDSGRRSASITFDDGPWPGVAFPEVWMDWTDFDALVVELENRDKRDLPITIRVHDQAHRDSQRYSDRFNRRIILEPGRHSLQIDLADIRDAPSGRQMDLATIDEVMLFATQDQGGRQFFLHDLRLVENGRNAPAP